MKEIKVEVPTIYHIEVVVMPNGEIICSGQTLGRTNGPISQYLKEVKK